jgi:hypothetical protein
MIAKDGRVIEIKIMIVINYPQEARPGFPRG